MRCPIKLHANLIAFRISVFLQHKEEVTVKTWFVFKSVRIRDFYPMKAAVKQQFYFYLRHQRHGKTSTGLLNFEVNTPSPKYFTTIMFNFKM